MWERAQPAKGSKAPGRIPETKESGGRTRPQQGVRIRAILSPSAFRASTVELRITEIFHSLQGESRSVGVPTVFVRLTGCPQRCVWCDTEYAFQGGEKRSLDAILEQVDGFSARYVTVTGGEPLAQPNCLPLLTELCDRGYQVSLETGGAMDIADVDDRATLHQAQETLQQSGAEAICVRRQSAPLIRPVIGVVTQTQINNYRELA